MRDPPFGPERTKFLFDEVSDLVEAEVLRGATVARADRNTRDDLVDQPGDPDHEEFVEVTREDSAELDALEKRFVRVRRQLEHAAIQIQPRELSIQERLGQRVRMQSRRHHEQ
jgi:hypothetical protein